MRPRVVGRPSALDGLAAAAALALVTVGTGLPLVMMVNGSMALGIEYYAWTWWTLALVWFAAAGGALAMGAGHASGAVVLAIASAAGMWAFRAEGGLLTFGLPWLIAAWSYFRLGTARNRGPS